jgi:hypothetical protein
VRRLAILVSCFGLLPVAGCDRGPRRFGAADQAELARALKTFTFPVRQKDFWGRLPFPRRHFKPWFRALTTGTFWDHYYLDDDKFLALRTAYDQRPDVDDWIDGASIVEIPGHPWSDPSR